MVKNIENLNAFQLSQMLAKKKIDPILLLEHYLNKYYSADNNIKLSFAKLLSEYAFKEANMAWKRQKSNERLSPLDGIPIAWKDVIDISYAPAYAGSKLLEMNRKVKNIRTAQVVSKAKNNGLISLAKTSTVEFAFGGIGTNQNCPLPENLAIKGGFAPGGSSTGSATAVFANLIPFAVGTDTAGSVRIPAAWHGLVGFKPTYNIISTKGVLPLSISYDTIGTICKSIKDTQLLFSLFANKNYCYPKPKVSEIKIAVVSDFNLIDLDSKTYNIYDNFFKSLSKKGFRISKISLPEFKEINDLLMEKGHLVNYEAWHYWKDILKINMNLVDKNVLKRFMLGKSLKIKEKEFIKKKIIKLKKNIVEKSADFDFLATPTLAFPPPSLSNIKSSKTYDYHNMAVLNNTRIANICNFSAISFPISTDYSKFNSLSLFAKENQDKKLLCVAEKIESILL